MRISDLATVDYYKKVRKVRMMTDKCTVVVLQEGGDDD